MTETNDDQCASFFTEQFKEHWGYLRHIEDMRIKQLNMFFILVAGVSGLLVARAGGDTNIVSTWDSLTAEPELAVPVLSFLALYGVSIVGFTAGQKKSYEHLRHLNHGITRWFLERSGERPPFDAEEYPHPTHNQSLLALIRGTFIYSLLSVAVVSAALISVLLAVLFPEQGAPVALVSFVVALAGQVVWCKRILTGSM